MRYRQTEVSTDKHVGGGVGETETAKGAVRTVDRVQHTRRTVSRVPEIHGPRAPAAEYIVHA